MIQLKNEAFRIIGICMEVYRYLGYGFLEKVYKDAIEIEAIKQSISFEREKKYNITYKGIVLPSHFHADFVLFDDLILEITSNANGISEEFMPQLLHYLKISGCRIGLLINFGRKGMEYKRLVF
jgi:GxxExxY protein